MSLTQELLPPPLYCRGYRHINRRRRRGIGILLVMMLITLTLALAYATVRTQNMEVVIQRNSSRRSAAQQAAVTGMAVALKKMQHDTWGGFGTTISGTLSNTESFSATYTFGDASLTPASPDYNDYPFRGSISITGRSVDPLNPQNVTVYPITAVVRLAPRSLSTEPSDWNTMQQYTVYQTASNSFDIDLPCQLSGPVRIQGDLEIAPNYPNTSDSWERYLRDLNNMRNNGYSDYRPFTGPVRYVSGQMGSSDLTALTTYLGVAATPLAADPADADWVMPSSMSTYQIYPGGPVYSVPIVSNNLQSVSLGPDPMTNPLGIFTYNGNLTIKSNVTIRGTLLCRGNLIIDGTNVHFEPVEMPGLFGAGTNIRLPSIICTSLTIKNTVSSGNVNGLIAVFENLTIDKASESQTFPIVGRVITRRLYFKEREPWNTTDWNYYYWQFMNYYRYYIPYFPVYMRYFPERDYHPLLTIKPDTTSITYHWLTPNSSVFLVNPADGALRWELTKWTENP